MNNSIYIVLGVVFAIYIGITITNRNKSRARKSKKFMDNYERKDKKD
ncbi:MULTISPECIES: hypothetical protein [unclassified Maribacter]|jgi:hypothetical protein|nr:MULTISPECIES: hypothetical protein [unclassified Maribacter]